MVGWSFWYIDIDFIYINYIYIYKQTQKMTTSNTIKKASSLQYFWRIYRKMHLKHVKLKTSLSPSTWTAVKNHAHQSFTITRIGCSCFTMPPATCLLHSLHDGVLGFQGWLKQQCGLCPPETLRPPWNPQEFPRSNAGSTDLQKLPMS